MAEVDIGKCLVNTGNFLAQTIFLVLRSYQAHQQASASHQVDWQPERLELMMAVTNS
jgi:hypothetical protein